MAKKISELTAAVALDGSELFEAVQGGASVKGTLGAVLPPGYIDGLQMQWMSTNALTVSSGAAYIASLARVVRAPNPIAKTGLVLTASTWYHVYLVLSGAAADIEIVATAPAAPYVGTARAKTGDTSRRYLGSVITDASGDLYRFRHSGMRIAYLMDVALTPEITRVLSAGVATAATMISLSRCLPVTASLATIKFQNNDAGAPARFSNSDVGANPATAAILNLPVATAGAQSATLDFPTNSAQQILYVMSGTPSGAGSYADVMGYMFER